MRSPIAALAGLAMMLWTVVIVASLAWNVDHAETQAMDLAYAEARTNFNRDITFRRWATEHGGVYVPLTEKQPSVPWLSHVPGRDVVTTDGLALTLLNPATMLNQMMDRYAAAYGVRGRITGLRYLNPKNAPDDWEKAQLAAFTRGERAEVWAIENFDGQPHLRYLRAMFMEPGCDKCHAILGYKTGDMRGATGLNLPLAGYFAQIATARRNLMLSHGAMWLLGMAGIGVSTAVVQRRNRQREEAETERERAENELHLYANIFHHAGQATMVTDRDNRIIAVNPAFTRLTGYAPDELKGENPNLLASGRTPRETYQQMWADLDQSGFWQGELWDRRKDGSIYPKWVSISAMRDERGALSHYIASFTDISERKAAEERIDFLAHHDPLTGLPNRFSLENRLSQALLWARRENAQLAVMFIDLDRFKTINDTLGHHIGDLLLVEVATRLRACVRESDIVARLGGDEFVVVLGGIAAGIEAAPVADKILRNLGEPCLIEGHTLHTSPSIGISTCPDDGEDGTALMKAADTAMYHAKEQGRNNVQFFTATMNEVAAERLFLERELRGAIDSGQLELHYQPQVRAGSGDLCGFEALARWRHPSRGLIPPDKFIPVAEESGLIESLGLWVLNEACRQAAAWRAEGARNFCIAINISAHQLRSPRLVDSVRAAMQRHGVGENEIELEVTETAAMANPERAIHQLHALRALGIGLAIDDFGTGYSSLAYLKLLPIHTLKLDRAFVRDIETDTNDAAISAATVALAHSLGLKVVAEGVETPAQQEFLTRHGCDILQGYLFGKPDAATAWSARWPGPPSPSDQT